MEIVKKELPRSHQIVLFGCTHMGSDTRHNKAIRELVDMVASTKDMYAVHMGDAIEGITIDDKRFSLATTDPDCPTPLRQAKAVVKELWPIRKKLLVKIQGNHEEGLSRFGNLSKYICEELGVSYGTYSCKLHIRDMSKKLMYKAYLTHGRKSIRSSARDAHTREASELSILQSHLSPMAGDCIFMVKGHTHKLKVKMPHKTLILCDDGEDVKQFYNCIGNPLAKYIPEDQRIYINSGSFLKNFKRGATTYGEKAEYAPVELGYAVITVEDGKVVNARKVVV